MMEVNEFDGIRIGIASPEKIREWSYGEVKKPETINYRTLNPERVRRERMGHIELASPVSHIWYAKGVPPKMGLVLDISPRELEEVLYFVSYIVLDPGIAPLAKKQTLSDKEYRAYYEKYGDEFKVGMGAEAIKQLLTEVDLEKEVEELKKEVEKAQGQKKIRLVKRLDCLN